MQVIYKYPLELVSYQKIKIHDGFTPLKVDMQNNVLCLWATVNPEKEQHDYNFYIFGTGQEIRSNTVYVGTVFCGSLVWHIHYSRFLLIKKEEE